MKKNVGLIDRLVRLVLAVAFFIFGALNLSTGFWWVGLFGLVFLVTATVAYCPIWHILRISTRKKDLERG